MFRRIASASEWQTWFPQFVELHQRWWVTRHKPGCFSSVKFTRFHARLVERLLAQDRVNLHLLIVNDKLVAGRYSFNFGNSVFEYQTGVDPDFDDPRIGLGVLCTASCIEDAIRRGITHYDFGEGLQDYKLRWTDQIRSTMNVRVVKPSCKDKYLSVISSGIHFARSFKPQRKTDQTATTGDPAAIRNGATHIR